MTSFRSFFKSSPDEVANHAVEEERDAEDAETGRLLDGLLTGEIPSLHGPADLRRKRFG